MRGWSHQQIADGSEVNLMSGQQAAGQYNRIRSATGQVTAHEAYKVLSAARRGDTVTIKFDGRYWTGTVGTVQLRWLPEV
jgi:hypothetical protein